MKVYTKTGDKGSTALFNGKRVAKSSARIEAYGTIDEANSFLGLLSDRLETYQDKANIDTSSIKDLIRKLTYIQVELFHLGSELATPQEDLKNLGSDLISSSTVERLEIEIDFMNRKLKPLRNFILPGGDQSISLAHVLRTITRRAERRVQSLMELEEIRELPLIYLNRLSDWFFVAARYLAFLLNRNEKTWQT